MTRLGLTLADGAGPVCSAEFKLMHCTGSPFRRMTGSCRHTYMGVHP